MNTEKKNNFWSDLRSAILFITILPAGKDIAYSPMGMIRFFPVVGLILGTLLAGTDWLASRIWPGPVAALVDVIALVALTGAFHLDGLGDAADGIFSHRSRERALEIMKDSRIGMMGMVVVVCVMALKLGGIYSLKIGSSPLQTLLILAVVPAYARSTMIFGIRFLPYGRRGTGTGLDLFQRPVLFKDFFYGFIPLFISLFLGYKGLILNLLFFTGLILILRFYKTKMNCITGDMLGAMTEVMEALLFLGAGITLV